MHIRYPFILVLPHCPHKQKGKILIYAQILPIKTMNKCSFRHQLKQIFNLVASSVA